LRGIAGISIHGPTDCHDRVGVVSFTIEGYDPQEVAATLDAAYHIQVRSGIHCAPLIHEAIGTLAGGGTIRLSLGPFTTEADIDAVTVALGEIAAAALNM
jgi:selenocysteine lyase/cysteine desulfurase